MKSDMVIKSESIKFTFQGTYKMYDPKINRPTEWIEQTIEIYKIFNLNFRPGFKVP